MYVLMARVTQRPVLLLPGRGAALWQRSAGKRSIALPTGSDWWLILWGVSPTNRRDVLLPCLTDDHRSLQHTLNTAHAEGTPR